MHEPAILSRRAFAAGLSLVVGATPVAAVAFARLPLRTEVEVAADRCRDAQRALGAALEAYERALPPPHFTIDLTDNWRGQGFTATAERRLFDGSTPKRATNRFGMPAERFVATADTIERDLCNARGDRQRRRLLYRMRRRSKARATRIATLEESFGLEELGWRVDEAERALEKSVQALFAAPATSMEAVLVQARALSAYSATMDEHSYATYQVGRLGKVLADGLQIVSRAA